MNRNDLWRICAAVLATAILGSLQTAVASAQYYQCNGLHLCGSPSQTPQRPAPQARPGQSQPAPQSNSQDTSQLAAQELATFYSQRSNVQAQMSGLQRTHAQLQAQVDDLTQQVTSLQSQNAAAQSAIEQSQRQISKLESSSALHQARISAGSTTYENQNCVFAGTEGCGAPAPLVVMSPGAESIPADAAAYIKTIPAKVRANPEVSGWLKLYEHLAHVRGSIQQEMTAAQAAVKANPDDQKAKLFVTEISGQLNVAKADEKAAKERLSFHVDTIEEKP